MIHRFIILRHEYPRTYGALLRVIAEHGRVPEFCRLYALHYHLSRSYKYAS